MTTVLHAEVTGTGPPLLALHGFTGSVGALRPVTGPLSERHTVVSVDLPGHGRTGAAEQPTDYRFDDTVDSVAAVLDRLGHDRIDVVGYSMGGRIGLGLAVRHPDRVKKSVLVGGSAGVAGNALLERGIEWFVDYWMGLPLFASQSRLGPNALAEARRQRLENDERGLAGSLRGAGAGNQPSLWQDLGRVEGAVLLVVGDEDAWFRSLAVRMAAGLRDATIAVIPDAGHACHLENPEDTLAAVSGFLSPGGK